MLHSSLFMFVLGSYTLEKSSHLLCLGDTCVRRGLLDVNAHLIFTFTSLVPPVVLSYI